MNSRSASAVVVSVLGAVACIAVLAFLAACGGGGSSSPDTQQFGRMTLRVTDSPVTSARRVVVEFTGVARLYIFCGTQFNPERSVVVGSRFLANFLKDPI